MKKLKNILCGIGLALLFSTSAQAGRLIETYYYDDSGNIVGYELDIDGCGEYDDGNGNSYGGYYERSFSGIWTDISVTTESYC